MQEILAKLQGDIIDGEIEHICNGIMASSDVGASVDETLELSGVTAIMPTEERGTVVFPLPLEEVFSGLFGKQE
jgi:hypothetical protein